MTLANASFVPELGQWFWLTGKRHNEWLRVYCAKVGDGFIVASDISKGLASRQDFTVKLGDLWWEMKP